jgi:hypothetical protein
MRRTFARKSFSGLPRVGKSVREKTLTFYKICCNMNNQYTSDVRDDKGGKHMAIFSEVQCSRCDRHFSGVRSRCPYCGARRGSHGKNADEGNNMRVQVIVGIFLMVALIAAVVVLLVTSTGDKQPPNTEPSGDVSGSLFPGESENISVPGTVITPSDTPVSTPPEEPSPTPIPIENVEILYQNLSIKDKDITVKVTEVVKLTVRTVPTAVEEVPVWECGNEDFLSVVYMKGTNSCQITGLAVGDTTLSCTVGDITDKILVRVKRKTN